MLSKAIVELLIICMVYCKQAAGVHNTMSFDI